MRMYEFTDAQGRPAAINLADIECMSEDGDNVYVTLRSKGTVCMTDKTLDSLLCTIEDYACEINRR